MTESRVVNGFRRSGIAAGGVSRSLGQLSRYGIAAFGPIALAATQFLLSLQMLRLLTPADFGTFSFLLVVSQLAMGLSNALFCAPIAVLILRGEEAQRRNMARSLFAMNLVFTAATFATIGGIALAIGSSMLEAAVFASFSAATMLRWFGRAYSYAVCRPLRATASDIVSGAALAIAMLAIWVAGRADSVSGYLALLLSGSLGMLPLGRDYLRQQFCWPARAELSRYSGIWREHSGWSLLGVVTTEATGNAHAYVVTLVSGAGAFAAIAASALLTRPLTVVMNALTEFERPRIARFINERQSEEAERAVTFFRYILVAAWLLVVMAAVLLLFYAPWLVFPREYDLSYLSQGVALWMLIVGVRMLRAPDSALLQSAGKFRLLAHASIVSAAVSMIAVPTLLFTGGPLWSVVGILLGEIAFALALWRGRRGWREQSDG